MKYMGSKNKISKYIAPIVQSYIDNNCIQYYYEPFVGGANFIDKISCKHKFGTDLNKYLIALLRHAQDGLPMLESVPKDLYDKARQAFYKAESGGGRMSSWTGKSVALDF